MVSSLDTKYFRIREDLQLMSTQRGWAGLFTKICSTLTFLAGWQLNAIFISVGTFYFAERRAGRCMNLFCRWQNHIYNNIFGLMPCAIVGFSLHAFMTAMLAPPKEYFFRLGHQNGRFLFCLRRLWEVKSKGVKSQNSVLCGPILWTVGDLQDIQKLLVWSRE